MYYINKKSLVLASLMAFSLTAVEAREYVELTREDMLKKSCRSGDGKECLVLAKFYESGEDTFEGIDLYEAVKYYKLSCRNASAEGCMLLAEKYKYGIALPRSKNKFNKYREKACKYGQISACERVEDLQIIAVQGK